MNEKSSNFEGGNGLNFKLKHRNAQKSILSGRFGDPYGRAGDQCRISLRASSPIWASEASRARTGERAAKPRGAGVSSHVPLARVIFTISPKWRACLQASAVSGSFPDNPGELA